MNFIVILFLQFICFNTSARTKIYDLKDIVKKSLDHNYDIKISQLKTKESQEKYNQSQGEFDWGLSLNFTNNTQNTPVTSTLDTQGNASSVITKTQTQSMTIKKKFTSGTEISLPYTYKIVDSDSTYRTFRETHEPSFGLTVSQPLLRSFVSDYYVKDLKIANLDYLANFSSEKDEIQNKIFETLKKVFQFKESEKNLELFKNGLETAQKNLAFITKKQRLGSASKIELLESETSLYKSKERFLNQKIRQEKIYGELLVDLGSTQEEIEFSEIEDEINKNLIINKKLFIENALKNRGDYLSQKYNLSSQKIKESIAAIEYLPNVKLDGSYTSAAVGDNLSNANKDLKNARFVSTNIGVSVNYNLLQRSENASKKLNKIKLQKENLKIQQMTSDVSLEVEMAIENYVTQKEIVKSFEKSIQMEDTKWLFYKKQFKNGKISSFDLAKYQEMKEQTYIKYYQAKYKLAQYYFNLFKVQGNLVSNIL